MNFIREWIEDILAIATRRAAVNQLKRNLDERLFLFAIEIGRRQRLTPNQRPIFAKTFRTAQVLMLMEDDLVQKPPKSIPIKNIIKRPEEEWLIKEPVIRAELEERLKHSLDDIEDSIFSAADRRAIVRYLEIMSTRCPELLSAKEIESIMDRFDHPLDRA
jgi:hypothetical protein